MFELLKSGSNKYKMVILKSEWNSDLNNEILMEKLQNKTNLKKKSIRHIIIFFACMPAKDC